MSKRLRTLGHKNSPEGKTMRRIEYMFIMIIVLSTVAAGDWLEFAIPYDAAENDRM